MTHYRVETETSMEMENMPMVGSGMSFGQTMYTTTTVTEASGDLRTMTYTIDSVNVDAEGIMAMVAQSAGQLEGVTMTMVVTTRGAIESSDMEGPNLDPQLASAMGAAQEVMGGLSMQLPQGLVKTGATWIVPVDKTMSLGGIGEVKQSGEMTFVFESTEDRVDGRHVILKYTGVHTQGMGSDPSGSMNMSMSASGDSSGQVDINLDEGRIDAMQMTMSLSGVMSMMGQEIPLKTTSTINQSIIGDGGNP